MYPSNHKTVFVLDHTPYFGISSEDPLEIDLPKGKNPGYIPLAPITKSLWTCSVEAAIEYCRITWDIFPFGKLVRFVVSDSIAHTLNTWSTNEQNTQNLLGQLAMLGSPPPHHSPGDYSVLHGLSAAIAALSECSDVQHEKRTSLTENASKILNRCRVICITSTRDNASIQSLEEIFVNQLTKQNVKAVGSDNLIPVDHCHLVIMNVYPNNSESQVTGHPSKVISPILTSEVHSVPAGGGIAVKLSNLILQHYDLASTTVTGIPMKEEQNASSSANYDVEIYHASASHTSILKGNAADSALIRSQRDGAEYETMTLKWCTPRGCSASEMQNCIATHRITPVDVNSRPSSCLINFLLNGRSVMLEMPRKAGGKIASHLLAAHGGEIFIHTLATARSVLEDPPSISEGCGGRVTDYRITDFGEFMRCNKVVPLRADADETESPLNRMRARLDRQTKCWPLTISSTFIFNLKPYMGALPTLMVKQELTMDEVVQCKQVIYELITLEEKHEPLQTPNMGQRGKGPKREEQYRTMWNELEAFLRVHNRSEQHGQVLHCLLECRNKSDDCKAGIKEEKVELDQALMELEFNDAYRLKPDSESQGVSVIRATTDSPMSPPPVAASSAPAARTSRSGSTSIYSAPGRRSLLDICLSKSNLEQRASREARAEFVGRLRSELNAEGGCVTKLYPNLEASDTRGNKTATPMEGESIEAIKS